MISSSRTVAPTIEPISLADAKEHLRLETADEDRFVRRLISAARAWGEAYTRRSFVTQTWALYLDRFPAAICLPHPPVQSVTSISYVDGAGATQTLSSSLYDVDTDSEPALVYPAYGENWPSTRAHPRAITVTYVAGYGADEDTVPADIRSGLLLAVARQYEQREPMVIGNVYKDLRTEESLLRPYQIAGF